MTSTFTRGSRLHARAYDAICGWEERRGLLEWRRVLVGDLTGDVVEVGAGTGLNLPHYRPDARVVASDFDPVMLERAVPRAAQSSAEATLMVADAMKLPFKKDSVDTVVVGLMFCSVPEPETALGEIRRVLRPGGRFRFVEHIRDEDGTLRARVQDAVNPVWRRFSGGCNANRRSLELISDAGFETTRLYRFQLGLAHIAPHVLGEAVLR